ncbi:alpha/beta fold hydrolase [Microbacterium helvum]|uniref:alpha/beta fold hydrolase n=1 Tax=Microbacterium helvum TaxID=2773713 RepID=UPI0037C6E0EE
MTSSRSAAWIATQRPASFVANVTPSGPPAWKTIPSWAVLGTDDLVIPIDVQRRMAERAGATITEVDASHVSMVSQPEPTLAAIRAAAATIG